MVYYEERIGDCMKSKIRKETLNKRKNLTTKEVQEKSQNIYNRLISLALLNKQNTLLYMDFRNEVATSQMIQTVIEHTGFVLLPRVTGKQLTIHKIQNLEELVLSDYGILEPKVGYNLVDYTEIDLILAPGVAFDRQCFRLGYGGGFYDKLLSQKRKEVPVIALAFDCQLIETVPTEPHDYKMDMIITEMEIIKP
jgi:5-formyltetrahydrofolate cyclo-ligase